MKFCEHVSTTNFYVVVRRFIEQNQLLDGVRHVRVAFSGGADSTALLVCLHAMAREKGVELYAHHIRHGLRASDGVDAQIARSTAEELGIPFEQTELCLGEVASNVEDVARKRRWEALEGCVPETLKSSTVIATAHNGDENLETLLWRLQRGCGVEGATIAVRAKAKITRIRPLLCVGKSDIYDFLRQLGMHWAEDPTNETDHYLRNRIRHHVLPVIFKQFEQREAMYRSLVNLSKDAAALSSFADTIVNEFVHASAWVCPDTTFNKFDSEAQNQLLRHAARQVEPGHVPQAKFIEDARQVLTSKQVSRKESTDQTVTFSWHHSSISACGKGVREVTCPHVLIDVPLREVDVWGVCRVTAFGMRCVETPKNTRDIFFLAHRKNLGTLQIVPASEVETMRTSDGRLTKTNELLKKMGMPDVWRRSWPVLISDLGPLWILTGPRSDLAEKPLADEDTICFVLQNVVYF